MTRPVPLALESIGMTERERWTVYPLLFLSLAIAMRSKITSSLELHEMSCDTLKSREVQITGEDGGVRMVLSAHPAAAGGGMVRVFSAQGNAEVVIGAMPHGGLVELISAEGIRQVVIGVAQPGGFVETLDHQAKMVRTLAVGLNPGMRGIVMPPPPPATEKPTAETPSETPPAVDEPAGDKPPGTGAEPADKPVDR
jgi:hypothetical protein